MKIIRGTKNIFKDIGCKNPEKLLKKANKKYKRTLLDEIKYYCFYAPIRWLDMSWRRVYWFFQRGYRGFGDNDTWDFDYYLATVISQGLKHFKKYYHGAEPTKKEIQTIIDGFEANLKMMGYNIRPDSKAYAILKVKFHKGMDLLKKYFNHLWD